MRIRQRADQLVFEQGLAESREKAKSLIMAGRVARQDSVSPFKPGQLFPAGTRFMLKPGQNFVSRGAYKLLTILEAFNVNVTGLTCLDAGASTGGFTDCLLQRGAARVYAIDVGTNQLHEKLRADERVISMEQVNLRHAAPDLLPEPVDFICADVSFISLTLILPAITQWLKPGGLVAALIKPQFELGREKAPKGVVRKEEYRKEAVEKIRALCTAELGLAECGIVPAKIRGPKGNQEYMGLFQKPESA